MSIADNYARIQDEIASACALSGRSQDDIHMIAVTKFISMERIAQALDLGIKQIGENRAQELQDKLEFFNSRNCDIHFIGQLQTNKVKYILGKVQLIQSVDRLAAAQEIQRLAQLNSVQQDILVQVNIGHEDQKAGIDEDQLLPFLETVSNMPNLHVKGLMCIPPNLPGDAVRPYFAKMRSLFERMKGQALAQTDMQYLSMGMSGDFKEAILEGSNMVRIGTALFGSRG